MPSARNASRKAASATRRSPACIRRSASISARRARRRSPSRSWPSWYSPCAAPRCTSRQTRRAEPATAAAQRARSGFLGQGRREMLEAYIFDGLRTPFGRHSGALSRVRPDDLLAGVVKEVVARSGFTPETIDDVQVGCASQAGEDSRNVARHALLLAGLPVETPGSVHNRLCGSGLNALA